MNAVAGLEQTQPSVLLARETGALSKARPAGQMRPLQASWMCGNLQPAQSVSTPLQSALGPPHTHTLGHRLEIHPT